MNAVVMIVYNTTPEQLQLTKAAVESIVNQDVDFDVLWVVDNGSTPETLEWLRGVTQTYNRLAGYKFRFTHYPTNISPVKIANEMMADLFSRGYTNILGVPNDVELPHNFYSELLRWPRGIVAASMTEHPVNAGFSEPVHAVSESIPMAVVLVRKWAHDALIAKDGYFFDEGFFHYASDCDLALRLAACGIHGVQLNIPYYHYGSASWRLADTAVSLAIRRQADADRGYFVQKWGFAVSDPEYGARCADINFRG